MRRVSLMSAAAGVGGFGCDVWTGAVRRQHQWRLGRRLRCSVRYAGQMNNILKAAEKMPADQYSVQTDAGGADVCAGGESCDRGAGAIAAGSPTIRLPADMVKTPADTADKDAIVAGLKASFAECDKAFAATTDANFTEMFTLGQDKRSRPD